MEHSTGGPGTYAGRTQPVDRLVRAGVPKIPASAHRHLLVQRMWRLGERGDS